MLCHPSDWAPVSITGDYDAGYARIASPGQASIQIRWQHSHRDKDLRSILSTYSSDLESQARKNNAPFQFRFREVTGGATYRWSGGWHGCGAVLRRGPDSRVFLLEATGSRTDPLHAILTTVRKSFCADRSETRLWSVLGLRIAPPSDFRLVRQLFESGKTMLCFRSGKTRYEFIRWGFAEQILQKYPLADWARASLNMERSTVVEGPRGLRLSQVKIAGACFGLVHLDLDHNQIVTAKSMGRDRHAKLEWDWIG